MPELLSNIFTINFEDSDSASCNIKDEVQNSLVRTMPFACSSLLYSKIQKCIKLSKGDDVNICYDICLNAENSSHEFQPGDTIAILPCNSKADVDSILNCLQLTSIADEQYYLTVIHENTKKKPLQILAHIPKRGTLRDLFTKYVSLRSPPRKIFLKMLANFTTKEDEIDRLQHLCSPQGSQAYLEFLQQHTLLSTLKQFTCLPPIQNLLEHLTPLLPRYYSIASSPLSSKKIHILFAVINFSDKTKGVCTGWLESLLTNDRGESDIIEGIERLNIADLEVPFYFRQAGNFRLPQDPLVPIIMVATGTGIAPFIGFMQHRHMQKNVKFGTSWLFYGCRYSNRDFLYKEQLHEFLENNTLDRLFACFSRENSKKVHVQNIIEDNENDFVAKVLNEKAVVYVCGDAKNMVKDVRNCVVTCISKFSSISYQMADEVVKQLEADKKYIQESWI